MSTIMIGHRRIQIRAILIVAVVFVVVLILTASYTQFRGQIPTFRPTGSHPSTSATAHPQESPPSGFKTFDNNYDNIEKTSSTDGQAVDPCEHLDLANNGATPQKVDGTWVLVTGGAGFIGSNLVDGLLKHGYKVKIFDNMYTGFLRNVPLDDDRVQFILGDIMKPENLAEAVKGVDYVFHLAAMSKVVPSVKNPEMAKFCVEANALGTWNVLEEVRKRKGIKKVIYAASSTYYGNNPPPHKEDQAPDFLTPYAASKYEGELQMQMFDRLFDVKTISARFFMVYGPRQPSSGAYAIVTGIFAKQAAEGKKLTIEGDGSHFRDFIHVEDVVNGLILSQQSKDLHSSVVNLGSGTKYSIQDVADLVSEEQEHKDERENDLKGTLADTCQMKRLLNYKTTKDFTTEMKTMVKATTEGEVFMQKWLTPHHALSAPHLLAPGTPMFGWPKEDEMHDLDKLLTALDDIKDVNAGEHSDRSITVIPFAIPNGGDNLAFGDLLSNTIFSLVRFGGVTSYFVAAHNKKALEVCKERNVPCFDAQSIHAPDLIHRLISRNRNVHYAALGNSYVNSVDAYVKSLATADPSVHVFQAEPFGDVFIRSNDETRAAILEWVSEKPSLLAAALFTPSNWPSSLKTKGFSMPTLCKGSLGQITSTSSHSEEKNPNIPASSPVLASAAKPTSAIHLDTKVIGRSNVPQGLCDGSRFYVPVACSGEHPTIDQGVAGTIKSELEKADLWHMTECLDKAHCDMQQTMPKRWVQAKPDLDTKGGLC